MVETTRGLVLVILTAALAPVALAQDDTRDNTVQTFVRGDVNASGSVDITDTFAMFEYIFFTSELEVDCLKAFDVNDDGMLDLPDVIDHLDYLFLNGDDPPVPFDECGLDETEDTLSCNEFTDCEAIVPVDPPLIAHVLRRMAHGQTPDLFDYVAENGVLTYIEEQLAPTDIDESENDIMNDKLDELAPASNLLDYWRWQITRGLHSERQLQEVLTDFWDNHFNTNFNVSFEFFLFRYVPFEFVYDFFEALEVALSFEYKENSSFRDNALGDFYDVLYASATSVSMLIYLDSINNIVGAPNENYAREILELHTMGVDNGYTQQDIEELAKVFTGWSVCLVAEGEESDPEADCELLTLDPAGDGNAWAFHFFEDNHDDDEKVIFSGTSYEITLGDDEFGVDEGIVFIEHLVELAQTAEYVSTKLIQKFVDDDVPAALLADCIVTWDDTGGDIGAVVETILTSDEFLGEDHRLNKVKTPMEYLLSTIRAFGGETDVAQFEIIFALDDLYHLPLYWPTPDGYPESGPDQLGTSKILNRLLFNQLIYEDEFDQVSYPDVRGIMLDHDVLLSSVEEVVGFWMDRLFGVYDEIDRELAEDFLSTTDTGEDWTLSAGANTYSERVLKLLAFLSGFPQHLKQ